MVGTTLYNSGNARTAIMAASAFAIIGLFVVAGAYTDYAPHALAGASVFALSCAAMHRLALVFNFNRLTIPGFWFISYCLILLFPSLYVATEHPGPYAARYVLMVWSALVTVPAGVWLASAAFGFKTTEVDAYYKRPLVARGGSSTAYFILTSIALALSALYVIEVPSLPIVHLIQNPGEAILTAQLREEAYAQLDTRFGYAYFLLKSLVYPYLVSCAFGFYVATRKRAWLFAFVAILFIGLFYSVATTSKSHAAVLFLVLSFCIYVHRHGRIGKAFALATLSLILALPALIFFLLYSTEGFSIMFQNLATRIFFSPAEMVYYYVEIFPDNVYYLYGRSIGKFAWLLGLDFFNATAYVAGYVNDFLTDLGSANAAFMGDANANFGAVGVVVSGLVAGFLLQWAQVYVTRGRKTVFSVSLYAFLFIGFFHLHMDSLQVALLSDGIIFSVVMCWVLHRVAEFFDTLSGKDHA